MLSCASIMLLLCSGLPFEKEVLYCFRLSCVVMCRVVLHWYFCCMVLRCVLLICVGVVLRCVILVVGVLVLVLWVCRVAFVWLLFCCCVDLCAW